MEPRGVSRQPATAAADAATDERTREIRRGAHSAGRGRGRRRRWGAAARKARRQQRRRFPHSSFGRVKGVDRRRGGGLRRPAFGGGTGPRRGGGRLRGLPVNESLGRARRKECCKIAGVPRPSCWRHQRIPMTAQQQRRDLRRVTSGTFHELRCEVASVDGIEPSRTVSCSSAQPPVVDTISTESESKLNSRCVVTVQRPDYDTSPEGQSPLVH